MTDHHLQQQQQSELPMQHASIILSGSRNPGGNEPGLMIDPNTGYGTYDPNAYSRIYNPYLTPSNLSIAATTLPNTMVTGNGSLLGIPSQQPPAQQQQVSPQQGIYGSNQRYITSPVGNQQINKGSLATHV